MSGGTVALHSVFVYGSLMADDVVRLLLNRVPSTASATLPDLYDPLLSLSDCWSRIETDDE